LGSIVIQYVAATVVLWLVSGSIAVTLGVVLAMLSVGPRRPARLISGGIITLTRGLPTSLLVVAAGVAALRVPAPAWLPDPFPGTQSGVALVAWSVTAALALGSTGHLAVIFRTGYSALGAYRREQARALGLGPFGRFALLARETGPAVIPPAGARLVHHLHNTAFAALFPVADLFGWVQNQVNTTFQVERYTLAGATMYICLSGLIWAGTKTLERLVRGGRAARPAPAAPLPVAAGERG
jgi:ABC-type amino acid transport system permease subunit